MHPADRATGKDVILDIVENMRAYQEELLYSSVVPTSFEVHLHGDDYDRLEPIFPAIAAEARRALDEELARQNRQLGPDWLRRLTGPAVRAQPAHDSWAIAFFRDENGELRPGEVVVDSRLTLPQTPELGVGTRTRRITTSRLGSHTSTRSEVIPGPPPLPPPIPDVRSGVPNLAPADQLPPRSSGAPFSEPAAPDAGLATSRTVPAPAAVMSPAPPLETAGRAPVLATLSYQDNSGSHTREVTETQLVIGRGGPGYWVDLRIDAAHDVSREHVRLRRDAATGQFYLKDVSLYGTTLNGQRVASSIEVSDGSKRDLNVEVPLPPIARIGLADLVFLEFRAADAS